MRHASAAARGAEWVSGLVEPTPAPGWHSRRRYPKISLKTFEVTSPMVSSTPAQTKAEAKFAI